MTQDHDLDGGSVTTWEVEPFEVTATAGPKPMDQLSITIDGQAFGPSTARVLAAVLLSAADQVEDGAR